MDGLLRPGLNLGLGDIDRLIILFVFLDHLRCLGDHGAGEIGGLGGGSIMHRLLSLLDLLILSCDFFSVLALKVDANLIIDERDDHAIVEWNKGGRLMILHLPLALHEDEGAV